MKTIKTFEELARADIVKIGKSIYLAFGLSHTILHKHLYVKLKRVMTKERDEDHIFNLVEEWTESSGRRRIYEHNFKLYDIKKVQIE